MLYIHFGHICDGTEVFDVDKYFNRKLRAEPHLVDNDLARKILLDVEGSTVINNNIIQTTHIGTVSSDKICGGAKALLLMNQYPGLLIAGNNCGDNCSKWIQYIARTKDVRITLEHPMEFSDPFEAVCENTGKKLNSVMEYTDAYFEWRDSNSVNWEDVL